MQQRQVRELSVRVRILRHTCSDTIVVRDGRNTANKYLRNAAASAETRFSIRSSVINPMDPGS
jgi:hypothetical protein